MGRKRCMGARERAEMQLMRMRTRRAAQAACQADISSKGCGEPSLCEGKLPNSPRSVTHQGSLSAPCRGVLATDSVPTLCTSPRVPSLLCDAVALEDSAKVTRSLNKSTGPKVYTSRSLIPHDSTQNTSSLRLPVHPDVRLKHLPFYDCVTELMKPTRLVPRGSSKFQENRFHFHLTPQQAQDIAKSRNCRSGARFDYTTQIQLRFCRLETSCEQDDHFPPCICVRVNGKMAPLPNLIPTNKLGVEPKRPGRPVDIRQLCRLSPTMQNQIDVSWAAEFGKGFCMAIYLVKKLTSDILLSRLKQFGNRHADHTRALIKEKLSHDPDSEVATTSLRVSLICPLGKMRISIPSRASTCSHLQCFDASTFLMMNEKKSTWFCPVCDKPAPFHKLFIDGLFVKILRQSLDKNDIQFHEDGSWSPLKASKEMHVISCSPAVSSSKHASTSSTASPAKKPKLDVIDLTISSDEEDDYSDDNCPTPQPVSSNTASDSSPLVIMLDSPTPAPSVSLCDSPQISSHCPNSNSSSSSNSSSHQSSLRSTQVKSPQNPPVSVSSHSDTHQPPVRPSPTLNSPMSSHTSPVHSPVTSPLGARISPVTPPTSTPVLPPFQPISAPVSLAAPPAQYPFPSMNFDPDLHRDIEDFLRGIMRDPYR